MTGDSYQVMDNHLHLTLYDYALLGSGEETRIRKIAVLPFPAASQEPYFACALRGLDLHEQGWTQGEILWALDVYNRVACHGALRLSTLCSFVLQCGEIDIPGLHVMLVLLFDVLGAHVELGQPIATQIQQCLSTLASMEGVLNDVVTE